MTRVICDLPCDERPRERMMMHGAPTLSEAELIALLVGCGTRGKNAIELSRELLAEGMNRLGGREVAFLATIPGMGVAKAARVVAAFELARRINAGEPEHPPDFDRHTLGAALIKQCARYRQERLGAVVLDSRHRIINQKEIFVGTVDSTLVSTKDIVRFALLEYGTAVVVYHNHPSGNCAPSPEDASFTSQLKNALATNDIELVDHLIIGAHSYLSMKERGML